ncbi:MAG: histidine phosphatase family protein [Candidatus Woesearchaeota archaeon]
MKILLTRHGETEENVEGILTKGESNKITKRGYGQIGRLISRLKEEKIDMIISSDLVRCKLTAENIGKKIKVPIEYSRYLREKDMGDFVGMAQKEIDWDGLEGSFEERRAPNGENLNEVRVRGREFFSQLLKRKDLKDKTILVVSHGAFLKVFIGDLLRMNLYDSIFKLSIENASLTELDIEESYKEGYQIKTINEKSYLKK